MNILPRELEISFDEYSAMQEAHIEAVKAYETKEPDLVKLNHERTVTYEKLKKQLTHYLSDIKAGGGKDVDAASECQQRLTCIREKDDILATCINTYRNNLQKKKSHMQQGKRALQGYRRSAGSFRLPKLAGKQR